MALRGRARCEMSLWNVVSNVFLSCLFAGITEMGTVAGTRVDIPCNTSSWSDQEVSLVLWFRGDTGVPIYRVDARNSSLAAAVHTTADELRRRFHFDIKSRPPVLRINPVHASDAAEYRCRVDYRQSRTQNVIVLLNVTGNHSLTHRHRHRHTPLDDVTTNEPRTYFICFTTLSFSPLSVATSS